MKKVLMMGVVLGICALVFGPTYFAFTAGMGAVLAEAGLPVVGGALAVTPIVGIILLARKGRK